MAITINTIEPKEFNPWTLSSYSFNYLLDQNFLINLQIQHNRETYARIATLDINEDPIEYIHGKVTGGSVSVDGTSTVRRTCNLTMTTENVDINNFYWGLKTKVKIDIGLKNNIDDRYPDIIWFPQGVFVLSSFNTSLTLNNCNISLSAKDKMCLLNGDLSGQIFASVDFGTEENYKDVYDKVTITKQNFVYGKHYKLVNNEYELITTSDFTNVNSVEGYEKNSQYFIKKIPIEKIIRESVHAYALEPYHNIIINDLDDYGLEQLQYKGDVPLYAIRNVTTGHFQTLIQEGKSETFENDIRQSNNFVYDSLSLIAAYDGATHFWCNLSDHKFYLNEPNVSSNQKYECTAAKIEFGDDVGYRLTDLVYDGDLISSLGDSLTSILDKLKTMLGDFEYFYDLEGHFVFQRKHNYVSTNFSNIVYSNHGRNDESYVTYSASEQKCEFNFEGNNLITAFQNSPVLNNVRNDYSIWGKRKGISGADIPIHLRYAIDKKPVYYKTLAGKVYVSNKYTGETTPTTIVEDWRELIYQMALDYFASQGGIAVDEQGENIPVDLFLSTVAANNLNYYPTGYTGYEQYYTDMQGFWRQLYNPEPEIQFDLTPGHYEYRKNQSDQGTAYYELQQEYVEDQLTNYRTDFYFSNTAELNAAAVKQGLISDGEDFLTKYSSEDLSGIMILEARAHWNRVIFDSPDMLNFWFDFLDSVSELTEYSIPVVGRRSKTINDDKVTGIYFKDIPDLILSTRGVTSETFDNWVDITNKRDEILNHSGYRFVFLPQGMERLFSISYRGKSAKDKLDQLLFENGYCIENITITSLPLYNLEPNYRVYVKDEKTGINGEYLVSKFTIPLSYNGTMSITATKVPERLY